jgi:hypothetical protein
MEVTKVRIGRMINEVGRFLALAKMARSMVDADDALMLARRYRWIPEEDEVEELLLAA